MTGIESLRELIEENGPDRYIVVPAVGGTYQNGYIAATRDICNKLRSIADQIERETSPKTDTSPATDAQNHSCHDTADAADVTSDAQKVTREGAEAIAWVCEHGGLDAVKSHCEGYVPASWLEKAKSRYERKRERLKAHALWLERKCGERRERIRELEHERDELRTRVMPEGMEWPRYESGAPVQIGDSVVGRFSADAIKVRSVEFRDGDTFLREGCKTDRTILVHHGERVKRSAKVLDADGVEIRVGDTVYLLPGDWCDKWPLYRCHEWDEMKVIRLNPGHDSVRIKCSKSSATAVDCYPYPSQLTHRAPVLAADGRPLREGETVYHVNSVIEYSVRSVTNGGAHLSEGDKPVGYCRAEYLTHERPDSWERLEEDAGCTATKYNERRGTIFTTKQQVARDLVRRAKALAERGQ